MKRVATSESLRRRLAVVAVTGLIVVSVIILGRSESVAPPGKGSSGAREILYVTNSAGNDVTVVDAATHRVIGSIETGVTLHGLVAWVASAKTN